MQPKHILLAAFILLFAGAIQAQTADTLIITQADTLVKASSNNASIKVRGLGKVVIIERDENGKTREITILGRSNSKKRTLFTYNILFDIGFNSYSDRNFITGSEGDDSFLNLNTSKSVNVAVYPFAGTFRLTYSPWLNLQTGLGIDWGNYRFEDSWTIANVNGQTVPYQITEDLSKTKLVTVYMNIPLMLKFNIPIGGSFRNNFYLSAGVIGGLKLGSHTKIKYENGGSKEKDHDSFNLNLLRYDLTLRAGYRGIGLFVNYQMSPMFEKDKGPKLYPYSAGLSVTL